MLFITTHFIMCTGTSVFKMILLRQVIVTPWRALSSQLNYFIPLFSPQNAFSRMLFYGWCGAFAATRSY